MGQITLDQSHQVLAALLTNVKWDKINFDEAGLQDLVIRNAKRAGLEFTNFLKNGGRMNTIICSVFRKIKVGTGHKTDKDFVNAIARIGYGVTQDAGWVMRGSKFFVASQEQSVNLVEFTVAQLTGDDDGGSTEEVFLGAEGFGLDYCLPEDGPQLRLQYLNQPFGEKLIIGMKPINNDRSMFIVSHTAEGCKLRSVCNIGFNTHWNGDVRLVFRYRK